MNKRFALIALLLAAVMLLSGCNLIGHDDELDGAQVVATVETNQGSTEITKAEWEAYRISGQLLSAVLSAVLWRDHAADRRRREGLWRRGCRADD